MCYFLQKLMIIIFLKIKKGEKMRIKLKKLLKTKGWTYNKLAKEVYRDTRTICRWTNGTSQMSYDDIDLICGLIGCSITEILEPDPRKIYEK